MTRHALTLSIPGRYVFMPHSGKAKHSFEPFRRDPALRQAVVAPVKPEPRPWCGQCERLVRPAEARSCSSQWCKAKLALIEREAGN